MIEKWDKSREKAQELRIEQWGTLEEVKAMSAPLRKASSRRVAMEYLKEIAQTNLLTFVRRIIRRIMLYVFVFQCLGFILNNECAKIISTIRFTSRSGLPARLSKRSLGKIVSHAAVVSSFCPEAHYLAAANIDKLYSNAIEPWKFELNPNKDNTGLKARRYLFAPMEYNGKITVVKITVKEYEGTDLQNNLYSIEAVNVDLKA